MSRKASHHDLNLLRSLEVFLAVAEAGQMTRAASNLGITQSAVSQHLSNLETLYATTLLDRQLRPMQLTLTGQALHQHARDILQRVEQVNADLDQIDQPNIPLLRVGLLPSLATLLTPVLVETATTRYQVPRISLFADLSNTHQQLIKSRQVDLLVTSQAFYDLDGLVRHPLLEESFLLVLPAGFEQPSDDLEKLARQLPMVRFSPSTPVGLLVDQHLRRCNIDIERCIDADRTTMIMSTVAAGHGFCILSPTLLLDGIIEGMSLQIKALPIRPLRRSIMLVNRENELNELPRYLGSAISARLHDAFGLLDDNARQAVSFPELDSSED